MRNIEWRKTPLKKKNIHVRQKVTTLMEKKESMALPRSQGVQP